MNNRKQILTEADEIINGDRNVQYGDPNADFQRTADLWATYLHGTMERRDGELFIDKHDVAVMMILLKVSRLTWSQDKHDHWLDIIGYAACGWDCIASEFVNEENIISKVEPIEVFPLSEWYAKWERVTDTLYIWDGTSHLSDIGFQRAYFNIRILKDNPGSLAIKIINDFSIKDDISKKVICDFFHVGLTE